jgi:hypothetical protein
VVHKPSNQFVRYEPQQAPHRQRTRDSR